MKVQRFWMVLVLVIMFASSWTPGLAQKPTPTDPPVETEPVPTEPVKTEPPVVTEPVATDQPKVHPTKVWDDPNSSKFDNVKLPGSGFGPPQAQPSPRPGFALLGVAAVAALFLAWVLIWGRESDED